MIVLIVVTFLLFYLFIKSVISNTFLKKILYIFIGYWFVALLLSSFDPFELNHVSDSVYIILITYVFSFVIGCSTIRNRILTNQRFIEIGEEINSIASSFLFKLFVVACDVFLLNLYIKEQSLLNLYSTADLRIDLDELLYQGNSFLGLGKNMVIDPLTPIMTFLGSYLLLYNRKLVVPLILVLFYAVVAAFLGGSRGGVLRLVTYGLFALLAKDFLVISYRPNLGKRKLLSFFLVAIIVFIIMSNMTAQRLYGTSGFSFDAVILGGEDLCQNFITYSTGPFRALDHSFSNNYFEKLGGYKFGSCTFGFIEGLLSVFLGPLGIKYVPEYKIVSSFIQDNWIYIGGHMFNFAYTASFMHFMDFGYVGIFICPFIFGVIFSYIIKRFYHTGNPFLLIIIAYLFTVAIDSGFTWRLYRHNAGMTLLYLYFLYFWFKKTKRNIHKIH